MSGESPISFVGLRQDYYFLPPPPVSPWMHLFHKIDNNQMCYLGLRTIQKTPQVFRLREHVRIYTDCFEPLDEQSFNREHAPSE